MNQKEVWDNIALSWRIFRQKPQKEVIDFLKMKKGKKFKILDLGCGSGRNLIKQKNLEYYCVDFSSKMIRYARIKSKKEKMGAFFFKKNIGKERLPFKDNFFDSAIFISTLHCIEKDKAREESLKEIYRVLKPDSEVTISVWNKKGNKKLKNIRAREGYVNWNKERKNYKRYYYFYDRKELEKTLKNVGFEIIKRYGGKNKNLDKNLIVYCKKGIQKK